MINGLGTGGAERSLAEQLPGLEERGIVSTVVCFYRRDEGVQEGVLASGVDVRYLSQRRLASRVLAVRKIMREVRADVVHTTIIEADLVGRLAAAASGVPVVTSLVNPSYDPARLADPNIRRGRMLAVRAIDGWTARHLTSRFLAITQAVGDASARDLSIDPARITVVTRGRDPRRLGAPTPERRAAMRLDLGLDDDDLVLLHVGRQEFQKGIDTLLTAFATVLERHPKAVLLQAGRVGASTADLERIITSLSLGDRVRLLGHRDDVPDLLAGADVFVFPSRFEGLGGSLIEAMALGTPIVASDIPAARQVLDAGANADLVQANDRVALASAITAMLDDAPRRARYGARGREIFAERFTLERSVDGFAALLRATVANRVQRRVRA